MKNEKKKTPNTKITRKDILAVVNDAAPYCYGVTGIVKLENKKGKKEDNIVIDLHHDGTFSVEVYFIIASDIKITETLRSAQKTLRFFFDHKFPKKCLTIDVYAEAIS